MRQNTALGRNTATRRQRSSWMMRAGVPKRRYRFIRCATKASETRVSGAWPASAVDDEALAAACVEAFMACAPRKLALRQRTMQNAVAPGFRPLSTAQTQRFYLLVLSS